LDRCELLPYIRNGKNCLCRRLKTAATDCYKPKCIIKKNNVSRAQLKNKKELHPFEHPV